MILLISHLADEHAAEVLLRLGRQKADAILFDTSRFPGEINIEISHRPSGSSTLWALVNGLPYNLEAVRSVWWRRPQPFGLDNSMVDTEDRSFAFGECHAAITGLWSCLDAKWINNPEKDEVASRKAYQLKIANQLGLRIPKTVITNDPGRASSFIEEEGEQGTIYKAFSATETSWRETRLLQPQELNQLAAVKYAPVIFQEHIKADIDLRITVIGDEIFPAEILSGETDYRVDFRMTMHQAVIRPHNLPGDITQKLHALMKAFGLVYGAIDMRLTPQGEYVFLEINTAGQWMFIEERTNQPITDAMISELMKYDS